METLQARTDLGLKQILCLIWIKRKMPVQIAENPGIWENIG